MLSIKLLEREKRRLKDFRGKELEVGDLVAIPKRNRSSIVVHTGTITGFVGDHIIVYSEEKQERLLFLNENIIKLEAESFNSY